MTIHEAIEQADKEKPNTIDTATNERWISVLEGLIQQELQKFPLGLCCLSVNLMLLCIPNI